MRPCLVLLYVCFLIRNINYCCSCSFHTATLYIVVVYSGNFLLFGAALYDGRPVIFPMLASAAGVCACVGRREQPNDQDNLAGRAN